MKKSTRDARRRRTRTLTLCSILTALGVVIMYLGSFIEVLDLTIAVVVSLLCIIAVIEVGGSWPWLIYAATSVLSLLLLPNKFPPTVYLLFTGFYPMLKEKLEGKIRLRGLLMAIKLIIFNVSMVLMMLASYYVLSLPAETEYMLIALAVLGNVTFLLYDLALTRLITVYIVKLRPRLTFLRK